MSNKLLYVEDETTLGKIVHDVLKLQGFDVIWEQDGKKALNLLDSFEPDICLLDIMLPNADGFKICEKARQKHPNVPIIFQSAKIEPEDVVRGFEAGGTEYVRKPFSIEELVVRIKNQLKLHEPSTLESADVRQEEISIGKFVYLPPRYELLTPSKKTIKLSSREGELLGHIIQRRGKIIDRREILLNIWGDDSFFHSRNLDVYIKKLRTLFEEDPRIEIQTLRGKGYLFLVSE